MFTGDGINMYHCSTRIDDNTTLEWILRKVAQELSWPIDYVELAAGTTRSIRTQAERANSHANDGFECLRRPIDHRSHAATTPPEL